MSNTSRLERGRLCYILRDGGEWSYPCFRIVDTSELKDPVPFVTVRRVDSQERFALPAANVIPVAEAPTRSQLRRIERRRGRMPRPLHLQAV